MRASVFSLLLCYNTSFGDTSFGRESLFGSKLQEVNCGRSLKQPLASIHSQEQGERHQCINAFSAQLTFSFSSIPEANVKNHASRIQGGSSHLI